MGFCTYYKKERKGVGLEKEFSPLSKSWERNVRKRGERERERNKFLSSLEFLRFCSLDLDRDTEFKKKNNNKESEIM